MSCHFAHLWPRVWLTHFQPSCSAEGSCRGPGRRPPPASCLSAPRRPEPAAVHNAALLPLQLAAPLFLSLTVACLSPCQGPAHLRSVWETCGANMASDQTSLSFCLSLRFHFAGPLEIKSWWSTINICVKWTTVFTHSFCLWLDWDYIIIAFL